MKTVGDGGVGRAVADLDGRRRMYTRMAKREKRRMFRGVAMVALWVLG